VVKSVQCGEILVGATLTKCQCENLMSVRLGIIILGKIYGCMCVCMPVLV
jgi:hypothetical protein